MGDDITIGVTEIVNNIEVTAQPNDQVIDINVTDNSDDVTLNVTPNVIEVNINKGSSFARWGSIFGNLTDQADLTNALFNKADLVDGKVPSYQLPSFVDDVIEVADFAALPTVGEIGKIYITLDNNKIYRWSGSIYIEIASNQAIWGAITGTLTNQTDLVNALNLKADKTITITPNAPLTGGGDLSANRSISINQSGASSDGFLSSTDWNTFNGKQDLIAHLKYNNANETIWNNGNGNVVTNTSFGLSALNNNSSGIDNSAYGNASMSGNTTGQYNSALGSLSLRFNSTGSHNIAFGTAAGAYIANSITANAISNNSVFLGSQSKALGNNQTNQIVIGYDAVGNGSNSVTLGNTSITKTILQGDVGIGTDSPGTKLDVRGNINIGNASDTVTNSFAIQSNKAIFSIAANGGTNAAGTTITYTWGAGGQGPLIFNRSLGVETMRLGADGNVGIGTTSPSSILHVNAGASFDTNIRVQSGAAGNHAKLTFSNSSNSVFWTVGYRSGTGDFGINYGDSFNSTGLTINTSGNVGIGTTDIPNKLTVSSGGTSAAIRSVYTNNTAYATNNYDGIGGFVIENTSTSASTGAGIVFLPKTTAGACIASIGAINENNAVASALVFQTRTSGGTDGERMRITSGGNVMVNLTSTSAYLDGKLNSFGNSTIPAACFKSESNAQFTTSFWNASSGTVILQQFIYGTGQSLVGSITSNGTTTSYNITSDYRLKKDFKPFNGLDLVSKIKVYDYAWKSDNSRMNGVIAHELQEVVPYAVTFEKDGEQMQSVDYSKLVPILVQAIKELKSEIELLKQK